MRPVRITAAVVLLGIAASHVAAEESTIHNYKPKAGYVPNAETAIKIAVAVWEPIYGQERIAAEKPYKATLVNGVWVIEGSLSNEHALGGVAIAEISKDDGKVLRVSHGK